MASRPRVLTIPASRPFLPTLARAILDGRVLPGWPDKADPLSFAGGTILMPNRRACRELRAVFAEEMGAGDAAMLLPRIAPFGDVDEDEWAFADPQPLDVIGLDDLKPAMPPLDRQLTLAGLIRDWAARVDRAVMRLAPGDPLVVSTATADALALAADLMRLMDSAATERVPWSQLDTIVEGGLDTFWQMTRTFLAIASEHWPAHLASLGLEEPAVRRDRLIAAETARLQARPGPLIAAGSTGSIPATRDLLRMVAHHPNGALVLPGLDQVLDEASWQAIGVGGAAAYAHPQFGLKRLIGFVGIAREEVLPLAEPAPYGREMLVANAMRPAETTELWAEATDFDPAILDGITVIEAANEREEALAVAVALRGLMEEEGAAPALVTPDRALAGRVAAELSRWAVPVDDSGGRSLAETPAAAVARLVADLALGEARPAAILALLTHAALKREGSARRHDAAVAAIELKALRGLRPPGGLAGFQRLMAAATPSVRPRPEDAASRVGASALADGRILLDRLADALASLMALAEAGTAPLATLASAHGAALAALDLDPEALGAAELTALLDEAGAGMAESFTLSVKDYPAVFTALIGAKVARPPARPDARLRILGLPEARLLDGEAVVMAGLVEGSWPRGPRLDPWLNRAMRVSFGIDPPERRIGLAAHDFGQLLGHPRVILSLSAKAGGVPTVPSRWLQRLKAVLGPRWDELTARGRRWIALAEALDETGPAQPAPRPNPKPPVALRPARLSVTEIETWQRDPYAIYARHVLKLSALEALDEVPGAAERGTVIHAALDAYARHVSAEGPPADPIGLIMTLGRAAFAPYWDDPAVRAVWWPRFTRIARWFVAADAERRLTFPQVLAESRGVMEWTTPAGRRFSLVTKADRIDIAGDGRVEIIDYKTGQPPSNPQVLTGLSPQLPLEAAVLEAGGFAGVPDGRATGLAYAKLGGREPAGAFIPIQPKEGTLSELTATTLEELKMLVAAFEDENQGYLSWAMPQFIGTRSNDYAHLARVKEWAAAGEAE